MIILNGVRKSFGNVEVLKNLSAEFDCGINFILGPSGSGKSTLLKLLSGVDDDYEGDIWVNKESLKYSNEKEKNEYYYNTVGFIWQDFKLIDHLTVWENIEVVLELSNMSKDEKEKKIFEVLKKVAMQKFATKKVSQLSGGQKQRVAIARAIVKDPKIIIADEPTGALDKKTTEIIMEALRKLAKDKVVIVVTHDKSLVYGNCNCYELKNGALLKTKECCGEKVKAVEKTNIKPRLSFKGAFSLAIKNLRGLFGKFILGAFIIAISSYLLLLNTSNTIGSGNDEILQNLIEQRGDLLNDIIITSKAISSLGKEESTSTDFRQDINGIFDKYKNDERIDHLRVETDLGDMKLSIDGVLNNYEVKRSGYQSVAGPMVAGRMPKIEGREVVVTKLFLKNAGLKPEDVLGKKLNLKTVILDHDGSNSFNAKNYKERYVNLDDITIVGVIDAKENITLDNGKVYEHEVEEGFYFSVELAKEIKGVKDLNNISFSMRVKDIDNILPIVNELEEMGVTAFGEFKQIEDILNVKNKTENQSSAVNTIIGLLGIAVLLLTTVISAYLRKNEIGIYKINGYSNEGIFKLAFAENIVISVLGAGMFILLSPILSKLSQSLIGISGKGLELSSGIAIVLIEGIGMAFVSALVYFIAIKKKKIVGSKL